MLKKIIILITFSFCLSFAAGICCGQKVVTAAQVNGSWREVSSKPAGVTTEFRIWSLGGQKLQIGFFANNAAGGFSDTSVGTAVIKGTTAVFKPTDSQMDEANPCIVTLNFTAGKISVTQNGVCGWGRGIDAEGTFKRISTKRPKFDEH